jgi:hypothetical protein
VVVCPFFEGDGAMAEIREVGIEKEAFLLKDCVIQEPKRFGFPYDEMGFLIELRSLPSDRLYPVCTTISQEELQYSLRANKFGMIIASTPTMYTNKQFINKIIDTYHILDFPDRTKNIYGKTKSHHLGVFMDDDEDTVLLTSGIHVHFSSRDSKTGEVIDLPVEDIVRKMDETFKNDIERTFRVPGEYEMKAHGFEYRSLPCDADLLKVLKYSFKILREA